MSLVPVDTSSELSVTTLLENARTWLIQAVEASPMEVAFVKAQIATAAEATQQLSLSRDIQDDAREMVRRAEYALGKAIRRGQEAGRVATEIKSGSVVPSTTLPSPTDFAADVELYDRPSQGKVGILSIADSATPEEFDKALSEARAEGNLSRANVGRKVRGEQPPRQSEARRGRAGSSAAQADRIAELAARGYSSRQIAPKLGLSEQYVRRLISEYDIDIPADKSVRNTRRINSTQVVVNTATALEGLVAGIDLIDYDAIDVQEVRQWATSLTDSLKELRRFVKQIQEMTQ